MFDAQYKLTLTETVEIRYRTETDTWTDEEGNSHTDTYEVPLRVLHSHRHPEKPHPARGYQQRADRRPKGALFGYHVDEGQQALSVG